jgi:hypothetical protein
MTSDTRRASRWRRLLPVLAVLPMVVAALLLPVSPAAAEPDCHPVQQPDGSIGYECTEGGDDGQPGTPGGGSDGGGTTQPTCDLRAPATFCLGERACWIKDNVVPFAPPKGPPPTKDADWHVQMCYPNGEGPPSGEAVWDDEAPEPPTLAEQARTAFGQLNPALGTLGANPQAHSLVSLPTWFWADGLAGELTGSSAFGLVAIAQPDHLEVTPGDGSATLTCDWVTTKSDACSHSYTRSSAVAGTTEVDGRRAYAASAVPVWTVSYEMAGAPVNIPGAQLELVGPEMTTGVRVDEVQATVTRTG